jgi:hypothetical protein
MSNILCGARIMNISRSRGVTVKQHERHVTWKSCWTPENLFKCKWDKHKQDPPLQNKGKVKTNRTSCLHGNRSGHCNSEQGPSWPWSYGSWIYNSLCNQCISPLLGLRVTLSYLVNDKLYYIMLYTSPWSRFELTTAVVICTDCIGRFHKCTMNNV